MRELDCVPEFLERFSSSFYRRRDLAVDRTTAGLHQPASQPA
jgi:hypothetical protein